MKKLVSYLILFVISGYVSAQQVYTLEDCHNMAMSNNKELKMAHEKIKAAIDLQKAAFTQYLPNISANGAYLWNEKNVSLLSADAYLPVYAMNADGSKNYASSWNNKWMQVNSTTYVPLDANGVPFDPTKNPEKILWKNYAYLPKDAFEMDMHNVFAGSIMMTQPLFMGGKIRELNNIAKYSRKIAEAQLQGETSETIVETDAAYWRVVSLVNKEKLAKSYVSLLQKMDSDLVKSIQFGVATKSDGLSVKVKLNEAEMLLMQVQDGLSLSKMALCQLCGLPLDTQLSLADESLAPSVAPTTADVNIAAGVENRYEVQSLQQAVNIAESNRKIMVSRFLPNAGLTAGYLLSNQNMYNGFSNEFAGMWQVGVVVNVPIFHFGEKIHTLNAARCEKNIAEYKLEEAKEKIQLDITQASFKINEAAKKAAMTKENKAKAEENMRYANLGFESGVVAPSVVMEAQTAWLKANSEEIDASIDVKLCDVYLKKALGILKN